MSSQPFRILSIDGGGVRGYLAASILANIEQYLNVQLSENMPIGRRFDLIAGTSVGGLIALGLALGLSAVELRDHLLVLIPKVFGKANRRGILGQVRRPRYHSEPLEAQLRAIFGDKNLADLQVDACVTSVSLIDAKPRLHKTDYFARNAGRLDETLVDVALATTAAPTYFKARSSKYSANLVDGGLAANNPSVIALIDAVQFERPSKRGSQPPSFGSALERPPILLSIGTGQPGPLPYKYEGMTSGGIMQWIRPIHEVVLLSQAQLVHFQAKFLLSSMSGAYQRIDPVLNVSVGLDDAVRYTELRNKADIDADAERFLRVHFLKEPN